MKQIIASVFVDILSYTIGNIIFIFLNLIIITARVYKLRLAEVNCLSCSYLFTVLLSKQLKLIFIPVTRKVKEYTIFVGKYVTGRRKHFRTH